MANDSFKIKKGLNIEPNTSPNLSTDGDIGFNSTDSNLEVYTGGSVKKVITNSQTQTLTNKTLTAPVISTISNTGTLTLPTSTDTLVGRATTDTLTNKTLTAPTIDAVTFDGQVSAPSNPSSGFYKVYVDDTTSKLQILDSTGTVTTVGTSAGGINYITNGDAESATTGWATYADAAGTSPVDGTGGSPTTTFTRSTSSPLRGLGSFLLTKDAANRQGEGASYAFTIADADKAKMMQIDFELEVNSGTYATGDVAVYIVDVTNSTVIQPSGYQVENVGIESRQRLTFQTASNSTSYRLCFHVASTSASAYALKIDTITLGPQVVPMGAPVTDWVSYSPTIGNLGTGSTVTNSGFWRRVGDSMQIIMKVTKDTNNGSGASAVTFSLPSGYSIDTAKLPSTSIQSLGNMLDGTGGTVGSVAYLTATTVYLYAVTAGAGQWNGSSFTANKTISLNFMVPIVGWSSSTVVSSSADTRVVTGRVRNGSNITLAPNNSFVKVTGLDTKVFDTAGNVDTSNSRFTASIPGYYDVIGQLSTNGTNTIDATQYMLTVYKNGSLDQRGNIIECDTGDVFGLTVQAKMQLNAGDYVELYLYGEGNNSASTITATQAMMAVQLIQGPSQIAASEVVSMLCYKNTGSHTSTGNLQDVASWNAVTKDSHGGFNTTTGIYTIPAPGDYMVTFTLGFGSTSGVRQGVVLKGSTIVAYGPAVPASDPSTCPPITIMVPNCVAGDTIKAQAFQSSGGNLAYTTTANQMYLQVYRLGGVM